MISKILGIIEAILKLCLFNKTDKKFIDAEIKEKEQKHFENLQNEIDKAHETDDIEKLRKMLGD